MNPETRSSLSSCTLSALLLAVLILLLSGCGDSGMDPSAYRRHCANCHGWDGEGLRNLFPPLNGSDYFGGKLSTLPCLLASGMSDFKGSGKPSGSSRMPTFAHLPIEEMTDLIDYLHQKWGTGSELVSEHKVGEWLQNCL